MKLPVGAGEAIQRQRTALLERADRQSFKRGQDMDIGEGRLILSDATSGLRYEVFINDGALLVRRVGEVDPNITIVARLS